MGYIWRYNPLTNLLVTPWDIQAWIVFWRIWNGQFGHTTWNQKSSEEFDSITRLNQSTRTLQKKMVQQDTHYASMYVWYIFGLPPTQ